MSSASAASPATASAVRHFLLRAVPLTLALNLILLPVFPLSPSLALVLLAAALLLDPPSLAALGIGIIFVFSSPFLLAVSFSLVLAFLSTSPDLGSLEAAAEAVLPPLGAVHAQVLHIAAAAGDRAMAGCSSTCSLLLPASIHAQATAPLKGRYPAGARPCPAPPPPH